MSVELIESHKRNKIMAVVDNLKKHGPRCNNNSMNDQPFWYSAISDTWLFENGFISSRLNYDFQVPIKCAWWHDAEVDKRDNLIYRFFAKKSWLDIDNQQGILIFKIPFFINDEALETFDFKINGCCIDYEKKYDSFGRHEFILDLRNNEEKILKLEFYSGFAAKVNQLYSGSIDSRYLSLAISKPVWIIE